MWKQLWRNSSAMSVTPATLFPKSVVCRINNFYVCFQTQTNRTTRLKRILEDTKEAEGEAEIRERMQALSMQLTDSIQNLHGVFSSRIFVAICRQFWDRMGQVY